MGDVWVFGRAAGMLLVQCWRDRESSSDEDWRDRQETHNLELGTISFEDEAPSITAKQHHSNSTLAYTKHTGISCCPNPQASPQKATQQSTILAHRHRVCAVQLYPAGQSSRDCSLGAFRAVEVAAVAI